MTSPSMMDLGPKDAHGPALDEVVDAIFRMFDSHIDAVAHAMAPPVDPPEPVSLVGRPATSIQPDGALAPHC